MGGFLQVPVLGQPVLHVRDCASKQACEMRSHRKRPEDVEVPGEQHPVPRGSGIDSLPNQGLYHIIVQCIS